MWVWWRAGGGVGVRGAATWGCPRRNLPRIVTLPPRSTAPTVAGCRLVGCSVVSGRSLRSHAVAGVSQHVCICGMNRGAKRAQPVATRTPHIAGQPS